MLIISCFASQLEEDALVELLSLNEQQHVPVVVKQWESAGESSDFCYQSPWRFSSISMFGNTHFNIHLGICCCGEGCEIPPTADAAACKSSDGQATLLASIAKVTPRLWENVLLVVTRSSKVTGAFLDSFLLLFGFYGVWSNLSVKVPPLVLLFGHMFTYVSVMMI